MTFDLSEIAEELRRLRIERVDLLDEVEHARLGTEFTALFKLRKIERKIESLIRLRRQLGEKETQ